jgi:hypothetical protein
VTDELSWLEDFTIQGQDSPWAYAWAECSGCTAESGICHSLRDAYEWARAHVPDCKWRKGR